MLVGFTRNDNLKDMSRVIRTREPCGAMTRRARWSDNNVEVRAGFVTLWLLSAHKTPFRFHFKKCENGYMPRRHLQPFHATAFKLCYDSVHLAYALTTLIRNCFKVARYDYRNVHASTFKPHGYYIITNIDF